MGYWFMRLTPYQRIKWLDEAYSLKLKAKKRSGVNGGG